MTYAPKPRTLTQNAAMHLWFDLIADALNDAGCDVEKTIDLIGKLDVPWNKTLIKELLWKKVQQAMTGKESTTQLTSKEVNEVFTVVAHNIAKHTGVFVDFPHYEDLESFNQYREANGGLKKTGGG